MCECVSGNEMVGQKEDNLELVVLRILWVVMNWWSQHWNRLLTWLKSTGSCLHCNTRMRYACRLAWKKNQVKLEHDLEVIFIWITYTCTRQAWTHCGSYFYFDYIGSWNDNHVCSLGLHRLEVDRSVRCYVVSFHVYHLLRSKSIVAQLLSFSCVNICIWVK